VNVQFSQLLPDLTWVEVEPTGEASVQQGTLDANTLRTRLGGTPEQVRSPWMASVFVRTDPGVGQPVNWLATMLLRQALAPGQQVRGPMVILGPADDAGEVTPASDGLVDEVLAAITHQKGE
jgi:hypothetical protein